MKRWLSRLLEALIRAYQRWISPAFPARCRYYPTCSEYGAQALRELGAVRGTILAGWRLLRCNPFSKGGVDKLEDRKLFRGSRHQSPSGPPRLSPTPGGSGVEDEQPPVYEAEELPVREVAG